jgi:hypothetical protein
MKINNKYNIGFSLLAACILITTGCERKLSDEAVLPSFGSLAEVFTDDFIGMGADFYFPFADAKPDVFSVDDEGFESFSSIRIDVPNITDPTGNYAGAIFRVEGAGRNLTAFDALTFYIKASQGVELGDVGYGIDYLQDKHRVAINNVNVGTNWTKVIIPIPDASKLLQERGMFWFAAGTQGTNGVGYTLWFDEIKFEKLGTVGSPTAQIEEGTTRNVQGFVGSNINISGVSQSYSLINGQSVTTSCTPAYYDYVSSDTSVAQINEGVITVVGSGTAEITASLLGKAAKGKIIVESLGSLPTAPVPTHPASNVKSIFSDAYPNATGSNFTPGFGGSTTQATVISAGGGNMLQYRDNNFTGIMFENTVNATDLEYLHIDAFVPSNGTTIGIQVRDVGNNKMIETNIFTGFPEGDDKDFRRTLNGFQAGVWKSFDIPLGGGIASQKNNIGAIIITDGPDFILDNIYFYKP